MTRKTGLAARILSILVLVGGVVLLVTGAIAWNMVSSELSDQKINVAEEGQKANYANGPFDALSQIDLIKEHTATGIENMGFPAGTVYTDVEMPDSAELAACKADKTVADDCGELIKNDAARAFFDNSNFKQASLYTSVLAFGVAALVMGTGVLMLLLGVRGLLPVAGRETARA